MSNQPQEQSYVDVKLLDCSRRASVEYVSGNEVNNAIFTNKLNSGIQLDVGDKINIHSAIISERGAGGKTIELKGDRIDNVSIPNITTATPYRENDFYLDSGYRNSLSKYDSIVYNSSTFEKQLDDNQVHLTLQYYKTTNGENCFSLPRLFAYGHSTKKNYDIYKSNDCNAEGATLTSLGNGLFCESDYQRDRNASAIWDGNSALFNGEIAKVRQDGTKFTIFVRSGATYLNSNTTLPATPSITGSCNANGSLDPAVDTYIPYRELKTITIPKGRRSADFIAETFTQSLQNASDLDIYQYFKTPNQPSSSEVYDNQGIIGATYKTDTFKPFLCANGYTFNSSNFKKAMTYDNNDVNSIVSQERLDWLNNFTFVAFKRPEFVISGRENWLKNNAYGGINYTHITHVSQDYEGDPLSKKMTIEFSQDYNDANCYLLSRWIKTQELYPELWDLRNISNPYHSRIEVDTEARNTKGFHGVGVTYINIEIPDPLYYLISIDVPGEYIIKREVTITNAFFTPNKVTVINTSVPMPGEQRLYINGVTNASIPEETELDIVIKDTFRKPTIDDTRFLHIDMVQANAAPSKITTPDRTEFGSDMYYNPATGITGNEGKLDGYNSFSQCLFFTYLKEDENRFYENPQYNDNTQQLSYGVFLKGPNGKIMITTESLGGPPLHFYNQSGYFIGGEARVEDSQYALPKYIRRIGYDPHFTAYGNAAIGLYTPSVEEDKAHNFSVGLNTLDANGSYNNATDFDNLGQIVNETYLGSSEPKLTYDTSKDRFGFTDFYTPEYLGNDGGAGDDSSSNPVRDGKAKVYKINKRLMRQNFAPGMGPYLLERDQVVNKIDGTSPVSASGSTFDFTK